MRHPDPLAPADQDAAYARALRRAGFLPVRTETLWRLPVAAIPTIPARAEHQMVSVTELAPEAVAVLDNAIRDDIPGTSRWLGTGAQLTESLDDSDFDPALYLIARHPRTGSLDGLVRVWNRYPEPRLGCIGVTTPWRRTSLALKLLQNIAATLRARGVTHITAETDQTDYDHRWLIDPESGNVAFWTSDTGLDGENPVDLEDVDLTPIDPVPSYV
jgi:hypothetical protein